MRPSIFLSAATICLSTFVNDAVATPNSENLVAADDENNEQQRELRLLKVEDPLLTISPSNVTGNFTKLDPGKNGSRPLLKDNNLFDDSSSVRSTSSVSSASQVNSPGFVDKRNMKMHNDVYHKWFDGGVTATEAKKRLFENVPMAGFVDPLKSKKVHAYVPWVRHECRYTKNKKAAACADQPIAHLALGEQLHDR
uniref:RxLR effector protein n=1 Tax=Hyaloperonospora arabidopsidis (strain Emoy2) TaxID=559515 RepID=M4B363_HYAAE